MYKKFILIMVCLTFIICGCSKQKGSNNYENENIEEVIIRYYSDSDRELSNWLELHLIDQDACIKYSNFYNETEKEFSISNVDTIKNFIKKKILVNQPINKGGNDSKSDKQKSLWIITVITENGRYNYSDFDKYPTYWEELWEVIVRESDAEDVSEFAVEE
ncbi:MAG: hypothetical protein UEA60_06985 [Lachnospiraceae bacterium]|nr:hypothetical protein [Lachnospiraceae bacterium]